MAEFTIACIDHELENIRNGNLSSHSLELFVMLHKARKYLCADNHLSENEAKAWVAAMTPPGKWTMEQTTAVMAQRGYSHTPCEFYAVMNAMWSDYGKTAAKYGADKPEFWADMANDWLCDADAKPGKAAKYYCEIVRR